MTNQKIKLIAGSASNDLAREINRKLSYENIAIESGKFSDGECNVNIGGGLNGSTVIVVQSLSNPVNDRLIELLLIFDALKRAGAAKIIAVTPYLAYTRKDRKFREGDPISAKLVADMIEVAGVDHIITLDLHSPTEEGFFNIPSTHLSAIGLFAEEIKKRKIENAAVISPDLGGIKRARSLAKLINAPLVIINKERDLIQNSKLEMVNIFGDIKDKNAIIVDDLVSSGGTLVKAAELLKNSGAQSIRAFVSHPLFNSDTVPALNASALDEIFVTNSCQIQPNYSFDKLKVIDIAPVISEALKEIIR